MRIDGCQCSCGKVEGTHCHEADQIHGVEVLAKAPFDLCMVSGIVKIWERRSCLRNMQATRYPMEEAY